MGVAKTQRLSELEREMGYSFTIHALGAPIREQSSK